jgi:hypothetical protein
MTLLNQLNTLESAELIQLAAAQPELAYLFRHALVQDAAYGSLLKPDRKHLHRLVAATLEKLYPDQLDDHAATLALHYEKAEAWDKATHYSTRAGDHAYDVYANAEAIAFYQAALRQLAAAHSEKDQDALTAQLCEKLAEAIERTGQHESARNYFYRALELQPADALAASRLYRRIGVTYTIERQYSKAFEIWETAESSLGTLTEQSDRAHWHDWLELQIERLWAYYWQSNLTEMETLCQQVLLFAEKLGTPAQRSRAWTTYTLYRFRLGRYVIADDVLVQAEKAVAAAQEIGRIELIYDALFSLGFFHLFRRELDAAEEKMQLANAYAQQLGDPVRIARGAHYLMLVARMRGQTARVSEFLPIIQSTTWAGPMADYTPQIKASEAWLAWRAGDAATVKARGLESLALLDRLPIRFPFCWTTLWPLLAVALHESDLSAARDYAQRLIDPSQMRLPADLEQELGQAGQTQDAQLAQTHLTQALALAQGYGYL